jgi:hypothetical protein
MNDKFGSECPTRLVRHTLCARLAGLSSTAAAAQGPWESEIGSNGNVV